MRAIGDQVFVEKDRLLGSALTCTGLTRRAAGEEVARDAPQLAAIRFLYLDVIEDTRKYSFRMNVIDREMDRCGC